MTRIDFRKWLAIGTGIGIEIGSRGSHGHRGSPASHWRESAGRAHHSPLSGAARRRMGRDLCRLSAEAGRRPSGGHHLLPREEVTVRQISLPGVIDKDLASAVRFEIDSLNPYSEEEVAYDWARIGKTSSVLIGITRRSVVERYTALFSQAGVKVASLHLFGAHHLLGAASAFRPRRRMVSWLWSRPDEVWKCTAKAPRARSFRRVWISRRSRPHAGGFRAEAAAGNRSSALHVQLPQPLAQPETYEPSRACLSYAAALPAPACCVRSA